MQLWWRRPEVVLIPAAGLFLSVNIGPWGPGPNYIVGFIRALTLSTPENAIFPLTWSLSVSLFVSTWWLFIRRSDLPVWESFIVAGTIPFAAVSIFELPNQLCFAIDYPTGGITLFDFISIGTWLGVGLTSVGLWTTSRGFWVFLAGFIAAYVTWYAIGYPTIDHSSGMALTVAWIFNLTLKVAAFPLAGWPLWERLGLFARLHRGQTEAKAALSA